MRIFQDTVKQKVLDATATGIYRQLSVLRAFPVDKSITEFLFACISIKQLSKGDQTSDSSRGCPYCKGWLDSKEKSAESFLKDLFGNVFVMATSLITGRNLSCNVHDTSQMALSEYSRSPEATSYRFSSQGSAHQQVPTILLCAEWRISAMTPHISFFLLPLSLESTMRWLVPHFRRPG